MRLIRDMGIALIPPIVGDFLFALLVHIDKTWEEILRGWPVFVIFGLGLWAGTFALLSERKPDSS